MGNSRRPKTSYCRQGINPFVVEVLSCVARTCQDVVFLEVEITGKNVAVAPPGSQDIDDEFHRESGAGEKFADEDLRVDDDFVVPLQVFIMKRAAGWIRRGPCFQAWLRRRGF